MRVENHVELLFQWSNSSFKCKLDELREHLLTGAERFRQAQLSS